MRKEPFEALLKKHPEFKEWQPQWKYVGNDSKVELPLKAFNKEALITLRDIYKLMGKEGGAYHMAGIINSCIDVLENPGTSKIKGLVALEPALLGWIKKDIINGWVFFEREGELLQPGLVTDLNYHRETTNSDGTRNPPFVDLNLIYFSKGKQKNHRVEWHYSDIRKTDTIQSITLTAGLHHETPELVDSYEKKEAVFLERRKQMGKQFLGKGDMHVVEDRWNRKTVKLVGTKIVVDDKCDDLRIDGHSSVLNDYKELNDWEDKVFERVPLAFYIICFNLGAYEQGWVHIDHMRTYVYHPELKDKLILPKEHSDLIDVLTADMDVLMQDIVTGKSGGTTILCQGKAGTGKTLTAEVYAECVQRPLYRVHSGQLGTDAESVETGLQTALNNASRWKAVLLIDEADVFVSQRDNDMEKNAVVGVFLRVLEYYDGLLFLTTNRTDIVDEAILSRCIAQISYKAPAVEDRANLWMTLGGVYDMPVVQDRKMAQRLAERFECTGRDIKGLIRLTIKYARQHKKTAEFKDFELMAAFKGIQ